MFKIVQTLEKGSKELTIIPSTWESNGELAWPKFRADKLVTNPDTMPDDSWFRMRCKLKRNHLLNYEVAEEELERMLEREDTEQEEEFGRTSSMNKKRKGPRAVLPTKKINVPDDDFNDLADASSSSLILETQPKLRNPLNIVSQNVYTVPVLSKENSVSEVQNDTENVLYLSDIPSDLNNTNYSFMTKSSPLEDKLDQIVTNQNIIIENQNAIMQYLENVGSKQNQDLILQQLSKFEAIFDTFGQKLMGQNKCSVVKEKGDIDDFKLVETLEDLEDLEKKLKEKNEMEYLVEKLSIISGKQGGGYGLNNCYLLVDRIFTRKFMTLCSWAGGARDKTEKIAFKTFKNVINLFFKVIHLSDEKFKIKDCEEFFKNIIRNSTRRNQSSINRISATKNRPKNLSYKIKKGDSSSTNEENSNETTTTTAATNDNLNEDGTALDIIEEENYADSEASN